MRYFIMRRSFDGSVTTSLSETPPNQGTREHREQASCIELSDAAQCLSLSQVRDLHAAGHLTGRLIVPVAPPAKKPSEKAAPSYRDPHPILKTNDGPCTCGSDKADVARRARHDG